MQKAQHLLTLVIGEYSTSLQEVTQTSKTVSSQTVVTQAVDKKVEL